MCLHADFRQVSTYPCAVTTASVWFSWTGSQVFLTPSSGGGSQPQAPHLALCSHVAALPFLSFLLETRIEVPQCAETPLTCWKMVELPRAQDDVFVGGGGGGWSAGLPTLQVKLSCQREAGRYTGASWQFSFNGQTAVFDTMSMNWTVIGPGVRGIQEEWENSQDLAEHFRKLSAGDCSHWLREFLEHWEKVLEPTGN